MRHSEENEVSVDVASIDVPKDEIGQPLEVRMDRGDGGTVQLPGCRGDDSAEEWFSRSRINSPPVYPDAPMIAISIGEMCLL